MNKIIIPTEDLHLINSNLPFHMKLNKSMIKNKEFNILYETSDGYVYLGIDNDKIVLPKKIIEIYIKSEKKENNIFNEYYSEGYSYIYGKIKKELDKLFKIKQINEEKYKKSRQDRYGMKKTHNEIGYRQKGFKINQQIKEINEVLNFIDREIIINKEKYERGN